MEGRILYVVNEVLCLCQNADRAADYEKGMEMNDWIVQRIYRYTGRKEGNRTGVCESTIESEKRTKK